MLILDDVMGCKIVSEPPEDSKDSPMTLPGRSKFPVLLTLTLSELDWTKAQHDRELKKSPTDVELVKDIVYQCECLG